MNFNCPEREDAKEKEPGCQAAREWLETKSFEVSLSPPRQSKPEDILQLSQDEELVRSAAEYINKVPRKFQPAGLARIAVAAWLLLLGGQLGRRQLQK